MTNQPKVYSKEELAAKRKLETEAYIRRTAEEDRQRAALSTAERVSIQAKVDNCWIYDPKTKTWYSPDDFLEAYGKYFAGHELFNRVQLRNPIDGLNAGYKQLDKLHTRLLEFTQKVMAYYTKNK